MVQEYGVLHSFLLFLYNGKTKEVVENGVS